MTRLTTAEMLLMEMLMQSYIPVIPLYETKNEPKKPTY